MRSKQVYVDIGSVTSFRTILAKLAELDSRLAQDKLNQFLVFNRAYFIVTSSLHEAAQQGYFKNAEFVEKFTTRFAHYYFQAINYTVDKDPSLPTAWALLNQASKDRAAPNAILLLMGANAHINRDLPLVMLELVDETKARDLLQDVLKVDKLLMKSGKKIIHAFEEPSEMLNVLKRRLVYLYYRPVMYMILYWRIRAWRSFKTMRRTDIKESDHAKRSVRIAKRFLRLAKYAG